MLTIFSITFPFFALVLCGYLAVRRAVLPQTAIPGLNIFVLYFALPCMLYRFGARTPLAQLLDIGAVTVYLLSAMIMVGLTMAVSLNHRIDWNNAAFGTLVAAFPNTGFMGAPLLLALLGPSSSGPLIVTLAIDMTVTSSLCIALSRNGSSESTNVPTAVLNSLKGMLVNPLPWAIVMGALTSGLGLGLALPKPLMQTVDMLADAASPVALFTIGAVLARSRINSANASTPGEYLPIAFIKLVLHPVLVFAIGRGAIALGLPLDLLALKVIVLVACLPSASNVSVLSERFGANTGRIARIIMVSTALSFFTFPAAVLFLA